MNLQDIDFLTALVKERSGIVLTREKTYLLESRLGPVARKHGQGTLADLVASLRARRDERMVGDVVEAMTTNESFFFRDITPFEVFCDRLLAKLMANRAATKSLRIWCAACSSGQEPYSVAMLLKEDAQRLAGWRFDIMATDISGEVLAKANEGLYSQFEAQRGLPIRLLLKYFKPRDGHWQIDPAIRSMVQFRRHNVLHDIRSLGTFDVVFCRNLLIYFDQDIKRRVLERLSDVLSPDGALFLGGTETVLGLVDRFVPIPGSCGVFRRTGASTTPRPRPVLEVGSLLKP